jgi:hypothetical protein
MAKTDRTHPTQLEQRNEIVAEMLHQAEITAAPDGIGALGLPARLAYVLIDAGVLTIAAVQRRVADDSIADLKGIGRGREKVLREALARWGRERSEAHSYREC